VRRKHIQEEALSQIGRRFGLSDQHGRGVSCDAKGVFVGAVPLFEPCHPCAGFKQFRPRPVADLNRDLSKRYGVPVEFDAKIEGLAAIARALDRGDILYAQIATLHLQIPDPPPLAKAARSAIEVVALAKELHASGMLKRDWDPSKHPRWPAGSPGGIGGEFAPAGGEASETTETPNAAVIPAQMTIPVPFDFPLPRGIPLPSEIVPPLSIYPRRELTNPYPDRPECEREWAEARKFCDDLRKRRLLGKDGYRGFGANFYQCVIGQISEDCGGNPTA
jgi:hypothetical protein